MSTEIDPYYFRQYSEPNVNKPQNYTISYDESGQTNVNFTVGEKTVTFPYKEKGYTTVDIARACGMSLVPFLKKIRIAKNDNPTIAETMNNAKIPGRNKYLFGLDGCIVMIRETILIPDARKNNAPQRRNSSTEMSSPADQKKPKLEKDVPGTKVIQNNDSKANQTILPPRKINMNDVYSRPSNKGRPQKELEQTAKEQQERIARQSFDELEFGQKITQITVSNLAIDDAEKLFTRNATALLERSLPPNLKLELLIGARSEEKAVEYIAHLISLTLTPILEKVKNKKTLSERERKTLSDCAMLRQKDQFKDSLLSGLKASFGIEEPNPTSSPALSSPKD